MCPNTNTLASFVKNVDDLRAWIYKELKKEPQLASLNLKYILGRGTMKFGDIGEISSDVAELAKSQLIERALWRV